MKNGLRKPEHCRDLLLPESWCDWHTTHLNIICWFQQSDLQLEWLNCKRFGQVSAALYCLGFTTQKKQEDPPVHPPKIEIKQLARNVVNYPLWIFSQHFSLNKWSHWCVWTSSSLSCLCEGLMHCGLQPSDPEQDDMGIKI